MILKWDLQNSKSAFERSRFNLVNALMNIEAKKKYRFLESISAMMDAHLRYFKLGYELLSQMEPFIHQVLTYSQHAKEMANVEQDKLAKRIQEYRTQTELENIRASSNMENSAGTNSILAVGMSSYRNVDAIRQSTNGQVQTIKQGYLLKRSPGSRGDWKRRFFVLDSQGALCYYRSKGTKPVGFHSYHSSVDHNSGVFGRFRSRHNRPASFDNEILSSRIVDLCTSTIKMDAEDMDLRLCFRIISPSKTYTLQAENEADRMDWINKITGAIASLLNSHFLQQPHPGTKHIENNNSASRASVDVKSLDSHEILEDDIKFNNADRVSRILRGIPGNDSCAECSTPEPDWASLNLGILLCIECSGVHRNLGVHISKVRSLMLDVKVWEPTVLDLFRNLGNSFCNSVWEELLLLENERTNESSAIIPSITKPCPKDDIYHKEKYIQAKYVEKLLVIREVTASGIPSHATNIWQAVKNNNFQEVYRLIVISERNLINTTSDDVVGVDLFHHVDAQDLDTKERKQYDPAACERLKDSEEPGSCLQGCSLLHLACDSGNPLMLELLLQFGADINMCDFHGRTPLHHCISRGNNPLAKFLLRRGALPTIKDGGGLSALERAMEMGAITDEELFILLSGCD